MRIVALDIGGTSIKAGVWKNNQLSEIKEYPTNAKAGGEAVVAKAISILKEYDEFDRIGISTAGQVDSVQGMIRYANENIPGYTGMKVKEILEGTFHVPVAVENDVNAAAIGEAAFGAGQGYDHFLCLTYGTGVGGAIVINKKIYTGAEFSAGEFGSMIVHPEDRKEGEYFSGCYEKYASTTALVAKAQAYDPTITNGRKLFERLDEDPIKQIVDEWIKEIMYGLVSLIHIFNPPCIVLGGGVFAQTYVVEKLEKMLYTNIMPSFRNVVLRQAELGNTAGLLGAVKLACTLD
ncbi:ROK family protein [Niameybacter massiliensis]|uniref:ROK family protein n=1 Tax=Holtiella tumoricola TaxID=3018743 RepID=A0AA42DLL1_9FIRM|nr:ROK family protein [Holtiella tumoricola]MDA3731139.1 ROK family protein [Holtiella tumoricola]